MKPETQRRLIAINQAFYEANAEDFSETRALAWPGWERALRSLQVPGGPEISALDVGCGNGRFGRFLDERLAQPVRYLGVDSCERLLELARRDAPNKPDVRFEARDVLAGPDKGSLPEGRYDLIVLFGLLHHVPAFEARRALLVRCTKRLAEAGRLIVTVWRFGAFERFRSRFISWKDYNEKTADPALRIDVSDLEPGDHLLAWNDTPSPRYCHYVDRDELSRLLDALDLRLEDRFDEDGKSGDLNEYAIGQRT